jgi:hypothetical protein
MLIPEADMKKTDFEKAYDDYVSRITSTPDHSQKEIRMADQQLKGLDYSFELGRIDVDMFTITKEGLLKALADIRSMDFDTLAATKNFEPAYGGGDKEEWANDARHARIKLLAEKFLLLARLRSDEPEAWDEVNELYFDD